MSRSVHSNSGSHAMIVGHSHVHWLENYITKGHGRLTSPSVARAGIASVGFMSKRGGRISWISSQEQISELRRETPRSIILCLGGNDIDSATSKPGRVAMTAMDLFLSAKTLLEQVTSVEQIGICHIVRKKSWRNLSIWEGDLAVNSANELLQAVCDDHPNIFLETPRAY